ncbi:hypothetical protein [Streptomyces sp. NPDC059092]|uniref:hypothetical protein n=1 Tax=Streptomyces sp. NPDC059092 TaxID=3346725 RepID=UPI003683988F
MNSGQPSVLALGSIGQVSEIADTIAFAASGRTSCITGTETSVDGPVLDDLILVLMANKGIHATQVAASRRFAGPAIRAFEACPHHAPLPPAPNSA